MKLSSTPDCCIVGLLHGLDSQHGNEEFANKKDFQKEVLRICLWRSTNNWSHEKGGPKYDFYQAIVNEEQKEIREWLFELGFTKSLSIRYGLELLIASGSSIAKFNINLLKKEQ